MTEDAECELVELLIAAGDHADASARSMIDEHVAHCAECREIASMAGSFPPGDPSAYRLGAEVARGGMGRIRQAQDLRFGRMVAVKELVGATPKLLARFEREARITACLQHPGIVPIYDIGRWPDGTPYYAMRMVEGATLKAQLAGAELAERLELVPAVIAATEAVAFAHGSGVIHRDLTPTNILVGEYGETVVIDWGLAKDISRHDDEDDVDVGPYREHASPDLTARGTVIGTAAYMPPEQATGAQVDARADVYALGAILYEVLAGAPPYRAATADEVLAQVRGGPPRPLLELVPELPVDLMSIVGKAMARAPEDRYPSAKELAEDLRRFQAGQLVGARQYSIRQLLLRWLWRHRVIVGITGSAFLIVVALVVVGVRALVIEQRNTDMERVSAEQLASFMLDDVSTTVDPAILADVESRIVPYYRSRGASRQLARSLELLSELRLKNGLDVPALLDRREAVAVRQQLAGIEGSVAAIEEYLEARDRFGLILHSRHRLGEAIAEFTLAAADAERFYAIGGDHQLLRRAAWAEDRLSIALLDAGERAAADRHHDRASELATKALETPEKLDYYFAIDMHLEYSGRTGDPADSAAVSMLSLGLARLDPTLVSKLLEPDSLRDLILDYREQRHEIHDPATSRQPLEIQAEAHEKAGLDKAQQHDCDGARAELTQAVRLQKKAAAATRDPGEHAARERELRRIEDELSASCNQ